MAQLIDIRKVTISPRSLTAEVRVDDDAPLFTSDDPAGTELVADLIPELANHACFGDGGETFGDVMGDTELAHLLEHVTVELLARTNLAGAVSAGQTRAIEGDDRAFELRFACPDDVLVAGALSSASWIIEWAYNGGGDPAPDVDAIAKGLVALVEGLAPKPEVAAPEPEEADPNATIATAPLVVDEPEDEALPEPEPEPEAEPELADGLLIAPEDVVEPDAEPEPEEDQQDVLVLPHFDI